MSRDTSTVMMFRWEATMRRCIARFERHRQLGSVEHAKAWLLYALRLIADESMQHLTYPEREAFLRQLRHRSARVLLRLRRMFDDDET